MLWVRHHNVFCAVTFVLVDRFYHIDPWNRIKVGYNLGECNHTSFKTSDPKVPKRVISVFLRGKQGL